MKALSVLTAALLAVSTSALAETKASVVLVHGAFADGSSWNKVITRLQKHHTEVIAVQLPLTSLKDDVAATQHVGDHRRPAKTCDIGRAGKHRLNNHRRRADVHHIEVEAVLLEDADFFSHYPGDAVEPERTVRKGEFDRLLRKNQARCRR